MKIIHPKITNNYERTQNAYTTYTQIKKKFEHSEPGIEPGSFDLVRTS